MTSHCKEPSQEHNRRASEDDLRRNGADYGFEIEIYQKWGISSVRFRWFKTHTEAERALKHFHNTFIDTSKLQVDICKDLGDETAPRPWSKYSENSSAFRKKVQKAEERKRALEGKTDEEKLGKVVKKKKTASALLGELENDSSFQEFVEVHKSGSKKNIWSNDEQLEVKLANKEKSVYNKVGNLYFTVAGKCKDARENATWVIIMLGSHKFT